MGPKDLRLTSIQMNTNSFNLEYAGKNNPSCVCVRLNFKVGLLSKNKQDPCTAAFDETTGKSVSIKYKQALLFVVKGELQNTGDQEVQRGWAWCE